MEELAITSKGRTTLPKAVRDALGVAAGDRVRYVVESGEVRLLKVRPVTDLAGALHQSGQPVASLDEMDDGIAAGAAIDAGGR